jgi:hypothetical protein
VLDQVEAFQRGESILDFGAAVIRAPQKDVVEGVEAVCALLSVVEGIEHLGAAVFFADLIEIVHGPHSSGGGSLGS